MRETLVARAVLSWVMTSSTNRLRPESAASWIGPRLMAKLCWPHRVGIESVRGAKLQGAVGVVEHEKATLGFGDRHEGAHDGFQQRLQFEDRCDLARQAP
jgi:hypothetical protein